MATKTLDKYTKAELLAHLREQATVVGQLSAQNAQLLGDKARLRDENQILIERITTLTARLNEAYNNLDRLESRRNYERVAYQSKLREQQVVSPRRAAMDAAKAEAMRTGRCVAVPT